LPRRPQFAFAGLFDGVPARDTLVHVIFEQQPASLGQIPAKIRRDERLEILTAPQLVHVEFGSCRTSDRTPDALASLGNHLVVHVFVSNLRE
jgi:hypothetical protein